MITNIASHRLPPILFFLLLVITVSTGEAKVEKDQECLRCHSMKTLAYQDPITGGVRDLSIDPQAMMRSEHRALTCRQCHGPGFDAYPHFDEARRERLECLECHKDNNNFPREYFKSIEKSFHRSIHFQSLPEAFSCFSCHNPHTFHALANVSADELTSQVAKDNSICLKCHELSPSTGKLSGEPPRALIESHAWLPEVKRHWGSVRCVECHTQGVRDRNHFILGREYAVRACDACHSRNSILTSKLYLYRVAEERNKMGFSHSVVMNDAYIIGMARNPWLDWGGLGLIVMTFLGVSGHALARWMTARRRQNHE